MNKPTLTVRATDAMILDNGSVQVTVSITGTVHDGDKSANVVATQTLTLPASYLDDKVRDDPRLVIRRDPRQSGPM